MKSTKKTAFTLVELVVIVAIIGGLMLLITPLLQKSRDRAQMIRCVNNMRQLGVAAILYAGDHDGVIPDIAPDPGNPGGHNLANSDYVDNEDVYLCPRDGREEGEFGTFETSYTAYEQTPASLFSREATSNRVMYIESDQAGRVGRNSIRDLTSGAAVRHGAITAITFADGHVSPYERSELPMLSDEQVQLARGEPAPARPRPPAPPAATTSPPATTTAPPGPGPGPTSEPAPTSAPPGPTTAPPEATTAPPVTSPPETTPPEEPEPPAPVFPEEPLEPVPGPYGEPYGEPYGVPTTTPPPTPPPTGPYGTPGVE